MKLNIFIPSAGLGERLRPITDHFPKPLLPILGMPVLQYILEKVSNLPVDKICINLHHKKELIEQWINESNFKEKIELFPENPLLETGGALKNAESILSKGIFLVYNSDILCDIDLEKLIFFHLSSGNIVTLAVHDCPGFNNIIVDEKGLLKGIEKNLLSCHSEPCPELDSRIVSESQNLIVYKSLEILNQVRNNNFENSGKGEMNRFQAFTGIAVYSPEFIGGLPGGASSVVDAWFKAISAGYKIGTMDVSGCYWRDIGTHVSYAKAVIEELRRNGEMVYIDSRIEVCKGVEINGYVVIEKDCIIGEEVSLRNCILLPGSIAETKNNEDNHLKPSFSKGGVGGFENGVKGRLQIENCIFGPGFQIQLNESEILGFPALEDLCHSRPDFQTSPVHLYEGYDVTNAVLIGTGGSDRKYFRVRKNGRTAVLMQSVPDDPDFDRHIQYTLFFKKYSIPVPELFEIDPENNRAIFEDLGDISLYSWVKCPRENEQIEEIYIKIIDALISIHTIAIEHISECPLLQSRLFDYGHLRWETSYFIERFVEGMKNMKLKNLMDLHSEFHNLALKVDSFSKTVIHRDYQSQNIMITKGGIPRILDYQGARIGPPAYDVVSLLWDPYYRLQDDVRERLLDYYMCRGISEKEFKETLLPCRLQRHMQALGAYGFLSIVKGKKYFQKYMPEGMRLLKEDIKYLEEEYPGLFKLIINL